MEYLLYHNPPGVSVYPLEDRDPQELYGYLLNKCGDDYYDTNAYLLTVIPDSEIIASVVYLPEEDDF